MWIHFQECNGNIYIYLGEAFNWNDYDEMRDMVSANYEYYFSTIADDFDLAGVETFEAEFTGDINIPHDNGYDALWGFSIPIKEIDRLEKEGNITDFIERLKECDDDVEKDFASLRR